jgi:hypothetical protein
VDSNKRVHISYLDFANGGDLEYATNVSGSWVIQTVDSDGDVGWYNSIAVDSNNKAHISYYDGTNFDLKYATNASYASVLTLLSPNGGEVIPSGTLHLKMGSVSGCSEV